VNEADLLMPAQAKKRGSRRRWLVVAVPLLLSVVVLAGVYFYIGHAAERELQAAFAEADRLDPNWRLADLEASRAVYPEKENSALQVLTVKRLIPPRAAAIDELNRLFGDLPKQHQLDAKQLQTLREAMAKVPEAVAEARKLADMPHGHFPIQYTPDWFGTTIKVQDARNVAVLLKHDILLLSQEGDAEGTARSFRALLHTARSIGDEPVDISQWVRIACRAIAVDSLERVLAQGEPTPEALAEYQQLLEREEQENLLLYALRGERAGLDHLLEAMQTGQVRPAMLNGVGLTNSRAEGVAAGVALYSPGSLKSQRAALLHSFTQAVEAAQLPEKQQQEKLDQIAADLRSQGILVRLLTPSFARVVETNRRGAARIRCAVAAVVAERYRRAHGSWPVSLDQLVADGLLKQVPADPYDGAPLRYRTHDDRVVLYSIAQDLEDNGGTFDGKAGTTKGTDIGFTLWNVSQRRLPPLPSAEPPTPLPGGPNAPPAPKEPEK
jgi:hypothetical protein